MKTIVSSEEGMEHCWINQNSKLSLGYFEQGKVIDYSYSAVNKCLFVFLIDGKIAIDENILDKRDGIGIWDANSVSIKVLEESEFLIIETPVNQK